MKKLTLKTNYNHMRMLYLISFCITNYCLFSIETNVYTLIAFIIIFSQLALTLIKPPMLKLEYFNEIFYAKYLTHTEQIKIKQTFLSKYFYLIIYKSKTRPEKDFIVIFSPRHNHINGHLNSNITNR